MPASNCLPVLILAAPLALVLTGPPRADAADPEPAAVGAGSPAEGRGPAAETEFAFIIADLRAIPADRLFNDPEKLPAFRDLAREGLAIVSLSSRASVPEEALRILVGAGETGLVQKAAQKHRKEQIWFLSPCADRGTVELAEGACLFAPDLRLPPYWSLVRRYGPPPALEEKELAALRKLRAAQGNELSAFEEGLGLLAAPGMAPGADGMVLERMARLIRSRKASFAISVLRGPPSFQEEGDTEPKVLGETDAALGRLRSLLREEPYRNRTLFAYLSLGGRPGGGSDPERPAGGCAVLVAPALRRGTVIQKPLDLGALRELILRSLLLKADPSPAVPEEVLRK